MSVIDVLVAGRAGVGAGAWLLPGLAARAFGLHAGRHPQVGFLVRLFGVRDVALAAGLHLSESGDRRRWLQMGIACDGADAVAAALLARSGRDRNASAALVAASALGGVGLGLAGLRAAG